MVFSHVKVVKCCGIYFCIKRNKIEAFNHFFSGNGRISMVSSPPPFVKGDNQDLKQDILAVEIFFWNFGGGNKRGWGIQCFPLLLGSCTQHKFSYSCYVIIDYHMIHIFYIFLLPLGSVALSGFRLVFTIDSMQKCEHKVKGKRFSVSSKESFLFLS